jgi:phosphohistidine phosphatase
MQLILWRHAQAEDGGPDLERALTGKGRKQAEKVAAWLRKRLPQNVRVLASPARRAQQTARALGIEFSADEGLAPGVSAAAVLRSAGWPGDEGAVAVVVGHQPTLGEVAAKLVGNAPESWPLKKGGLWWLEQRARGGRTEVLVRAVISPDLV